MEINPYESPQTAKDQNQTEDSPLRTWLVDRAMALAIAAIAITLFMGPTWIRIWLLGF